MTLEEQLATALAERDRYKAARDTALGQIVDLRDQADDLEAEIAALEAEELRPLADRLRGKVGVIRQAMADLVEQLGQLEAGGA